MKRARALISEKAFHPGIGYALDLRFREEMVDMQDGLGNAKRLDGLFTLHIQTLPFPSPPFPLK